ncbi:helix-turn-helix domain-containing protein [Listeria newyorkensis]|uniref:Helix-turn-helix transcriptional regulator n=1 Tax=Listeria newyorkensis TaxID=1497681 RepID=A0A841YSK6_9LIST|nr:helix-turn-helix transcriptional regulator [Listeria newyorkensis]MBC1456255.1 helix-turn-helix transcriptional regulator [Listeria newyorkensis]
MSTFDRVKKLCADRGISIQDLARNLDMGVNIIYKWKDRIPSGENLQKVADYFNVSVDYLLGRTENKYLSAQLEELINDRELNAWLYDMIENRPEDIKRVKEIMDIMVANSTKHEK